MSTVAAGESARAALDARPAVAELDGVRLTYGSSPPVAALRGCDLSVRAGEMVAVMGRSGSGKTTLLHVLGLLHRPDEGTYRLDGFDVSTLGERARARLRSRDIGFVFQSFHLIGHSTAVENVTLALLHKGTPRKARRGLAEEALSRLGLSHRLHAMPNQLSGGEQQRVAIARAIVGSPRLLLCDEPTGDLDSQTADEVLTRLGELNAEGVTTVVITHDPRVASTAGRRFRMVDGTIAEEDTRS